MTNGKSTKPLFIAPKLPPHSAHQQVKHQLQQHGGSLMYTPAPVATAAASAPTGQQQPQHHQQQFFIAPHMAMPQLLASMLQSGNVNANSALAQLVAQNPVVIGRTPSLSTLMPMATSASAPSPIAPAPPSASPMFHPQLMGTQNMTFASAPATAAVAAAAKPPANTSQPARTISISSTPAPAPVKKVAAAASPPLPQPPVEQPTPKPVEPKPIDFLWSLLGDTTVQEAAKLKWRQQQPTFSKPCDQALAAYSLDAVNAIRAKDVDKLKELFQIKGTLDACNRFGESLLHMACRRGELDIVQYMIGDAKVNVHVRDDFGRTVLHDALWTSKPNFDLVDCLLRYAPAQMLLAADVRGNTPLEYARKEHAGTWLKFLEERKETLSKRLREEMGVA